MTQSEARQLLYSYAVGMVAGGHPDLPKARTMLGTDVTIKILNYKKPRSIDPRLLIPGLRREPISQNDPAP